jgi:hypothetical protein
MREMRQWHITRWMLMVFSAAALVVADGATGVATEWLGPKPPGAAYPTGEEDRQYAVLAYDLKQREHFEKYGSENYHPDAMILTIDRDPLDVVLRRTAALLSDIRRMPSTPDLSALQSELEKLIQQAGLVPVADEAARRAVFDRALHLRRRIALANPLLSFRDILFIKRQVAGVYYHMCDQFYGMAQEPGGGVFVLHDAFGAAPRLRDVLENSEVGNGRLQGERLSGGPRRRWKLSYDINSATLAGEATEGGSFLSPALSYDAKTLLFAFVECKGPGTHDTHLEPSKRGYWPETRCYHVFKVGIDGSDLTMLTDGSWNEFSPCWTPAGRIAFISERRGGYLRCGRTCPTYTLFDMSADGRDIRCLSYHDTNEWAPSIDHDGKIVWTRWDYIDRHNAAAHLGWTTTPDGRDARQLHGNYAPRHLRADMETDFQAIPDSRKYVATATGHHGQSFGSLVIIDPSVPDDDGMGPVKRLTPEIGFPESQGEAVPFYGYGTAWPLSENYFLCAYERADVKGVGTPLVFGLYLVDRFGNKELIYRDPEIACLNPIPLRPRAVPPVLPEASGAAADREATVSLMNVYDSLKPFPAGTNIKTLRIWQVFPESLPTIALRHETGVEIAGTDAINPVRALIGEVPVEVDGSAHFTVPAQKQLFFQAIDEEGCAVQSMRAGVYFQRGEHASCRGCHEQRDRAPAISAPQSLLALRRPASAPKAGPDGSFPFSYPRLVQPVLDKYCVSCHRAEGGDRPRLDSAVIGYPRGNTTRYASSDFYASYVSLIPYSFRDYGNTYRTTPGQFGARASKLYPVLKKEHYGLKLPPDELRRIVLWLDSASQFYGVYEPERGKSQLRGEAVGPAIE